MRQNVNPVVAVAAVVVILALVVAVAVSMFSGPGTKSGLKEYTVKVANPNDPRYRADPKLGGGK